MKHRYTSQIITLLVAAILIVWLLPRTSTSTYIYEVNRPWNYQLLTAPFDIPVRLDSLSAQEARDSVDRHFIPVFRRNAQVSDDIRSSLSEALTEVQGISNTTRSRVVAKVRQVYNDGVVDEDVYSAITNGRLPQIRITKGNVLSSIPSTNYRSPRKAYEWLRSELKSDEEHYAIEQSKLSAMLVPNMLIDTVTSRRLRSEQYQKATAPIGVIQQGERIIDRGDIVSLRLHTILHTYEAMQAKRGNGPGGNNLYVWLAKFLFVGTLMAMLGLFLYFFRRRLFRQPKVVLFLAGNVVLFALLAALLSSGFDQGLYIVPFSMIPIMVLVFFDGRTAMFTTMVTVITAAIMAPYPLEFISMQFVGASIAINSLKEMSRRSQLLRTALLVFLGYAVTYTSVNVMLTGTFASLSPRMFGFLAINVVFVSFAYVLIFVFERLLGFTSMVGLVELCDINHPVLRELSRECPGTFQHSMAVSNLAAEAAAKLDANVQLVRAGALYHDIGKIDNPAFFTENQHGVNPHDALDPLQSARIITGHVTDGLRRAEKAKLPAVIRNFISEHHGKGVARYFYITYCNQHPGEDVDRAPFTYAGPNPRSIETSILMMADSVEAASRSLKEYSPEAITELVNKIIDGQISEGLHSDSPLSFRDVKVIKETFISRLLTLYHSRIAYPTEKK